MGNITTGLTSNTSQQSNTANNTSTSTPNQPAWMSLFQQNLQPQYQNLINQAQQPVYGQAQEAGQLNNLNSLANNSMNQLSNTFASKGILNSGATANALSGVEQGKDSSMANYLAQIPQLNQQAEQTNTQNALNSASGWIGKPAVGATTTGNSSGTQDSNNLQTQQTPFLSSLLSSLMGIGGYAAGGGIDKALGF